MTYVLYLFESPKDELSSEKVDLCDWPEFDDNLIQLNNSIKLLTHFRDPSSS